MSRLLATLTCAVLVAACSSSSSTDPYDRYQQLKPNDAPAISRDDALTRAALGCSTKWPKGTTDWALHEAYASTVCK